MKVNETTLLQALYDVFAENGVYVGGRMLRSDLDAQWREIGLRAEDLGHAIRIGEETAFVRRETVDGEACVALLMDEVPSELRQTSLLKRLFNGTTSLVTLARARGRGHAATRGAETPQRRARDRRSKPEQKD